MSKRLLINSILTLIGAAAILVAQQPPPTAQEAAPPEPTGSPVAPQPQVKSQEELEAIQAIQSALDPTSRIQACEDLVVKFPESEFKTFALQMATLSAQQLNDYEKMMIYGDRTLEVDPQNYMVMLAMANGLAQRTREFDLDKEEKLDRAVKLANDAIEIIKSAPRPNPQLTDEQWETAKSDFTAQAHEALGLVAMVRKDYNTAIKEFQTAVEIGVIPNPSTKVRLAACYTAAGNPGEAIVTLDEVLAEAQLHPAIRKIAQAERARAVKLKDAKK